MSLLKIIIKKYIKMKKSREDSIEGREQEHNLTTKNE
jgi:hypothetical protein